MFLRPTALFLEARKYAEKLFGSTIYLNIYGANGREKVMMQGYFSVQIFPFFSSPTDTSGPMSESK